MRFDEASKTRKWLQSYNVMRPLKINDCLKKNNRQNRKKEKYKKLAKIVKEKLVVSTVDSRSSKLIYPFCVVI